MTAVLGLAHGGRVYLASDSFVGDEVIAEDCREPKVWKLGKSGFAVGAAGSIRLVQLLRHRLRVGAVDRENIHRWLVTDFVDAVWVALRGYSRANLDPAYEGGESYELELLVGGHGGVWKIQNGETVLQCASGFGGVGAGGLAGRAALAATRRLGLAPKARLELALEIAEGCAPLVRRPWQWVSVA